MKTFVYFILTCMISTSAFFAATKMKDPFPACIVALATWGLFFWGWYHRIQKQQQRRSQEQLFADYMRSKIRNDRSRA